MGFPFLFVGSQVSLQRFIEHAPGVRSTRPWLLGGCWAPSSFSLRPPHQPRAMRIDEISWSLGSFSWFFQVFFLVFKSHHLLFVGCCAFSGSLSANQRGLWGPGSGTVQEFVDPKVGLWAQQFPWIVRWIVYIYIYTYLVHGISVVLNHGIYIYLNNS